MQSGTSLRRRLKAFIDIIEGEAAQNPDFAARLAAFFGEASRHPVAKTRASPKRLRTNNVPDVFAVLQEKGDEEFKFWLRTLDRVTLKAIVKQNGFDPARVSQRWSDSDKFVALVEEQTHARLRRGSAFLPPRGQTSQGDL